MAFKAENKARLPAEECRHEDGGVNVQRGMPPTVREIYDLQGETVN